MSFVLHRSMIFRMLSFFLIFNLLFSCCNNPIEESKKRNILFYIAAGQNVIDNDAPGKMNQIRAGWVPGNGEMIIYVDKVEQGACLLRVNEIKNSQGYYGLDTLEVYGHENSADSEVLSRVINKVVRDFPADSYGMIFFSHGSGWLPEGFLSRPRSLVIDNNNGGGKTNREMEYYDFANAIPDKQFDFIIMEACLMSDIIFLYEMRNKAEYILASSAEIVVPGFTRTNTYKNDIMRLYNTRSDIKSVVAGFAKSYYDGIITLPENDIYCSTTLSVIKLDEIENLAAVTKTVLKGKDFEEKNLLVDSIQHFDRPKSDQVSNGNRNNKYFDLGHAVENLVSASDYNTFNTQMEKTVVWKASTKRFMLHNYGDGSPNYSSYDGFFIKRHSGISTYIKQNVFPELNSAYEESLWYKAIR